METKQSEAGTRLAWRPSEYRFNAATCPSWMGTSGQLPSGCWTPLVDILRECWGRQHSLSFATFVTDLVEGSLVLRRGGGAYRALKSFPDTSLLGVQVLILVMDIGDSRVTSRSLA